jgi:hypothetical protein|tara:strand:+ start:113 stop:307 length:195 start_codon:yes stop_codon:yes gene_type:complete
MGNKMKQNLGVLVFYIACLVSLIFIVIGTVLDDVLLLATGSLFIVCAALIKAEFNLHVLFWRKI